MTLRMVLSFSREKCAFVSAQNNLNLNLRDSDNSKQSFSPCKEGPVYDWFIPVPIVLVFDTLFKVSPFSPNPYSPLFSWRLWLCLGFLVLSSPLWKQQMSLGEKWPRTLASTLEVCLFPYTDHDSLLFYQFFDTFKQPFGIFSSCVHQDGTSNFLVLSFAIFFFYLSLLKWLLPMSLISLICSVQWAVFSLYLTRSLYV